MKNDLDALGQSVEYFFEQKIGLERRDNAKQITYCFMGYAVAMVRKNRRCVVVAWAQGAKLASSFALLKGDAKIVRSVELESWTAKIQQSFEQMVEETKIIIFENRAKRELKGAWNETK